MDIVLKHVIAPNKFDENVRVAENSRSRQGMQFLLLRVLVIVRLLPAVLLFNKPF